jgi:hypothetical protein
MSSPPPPLLPQVVQDCHDLLLWLIPHLDKFPRKRRLTLGEHKRAAIASEPPHPRWHGGRR